MSLYTLTGGFAVHRSRSPSSGGRTRSVAACSGRDIVGRFNLMARSRPWVKPLTRRSNANEVCYSRSVGDELTLAEALALAERRKP